MKALDADFTEVRKSSPSRSRWYILVGLLAPFTVLTYLAVSSGSPDDVRDRPVSLTTLATITGPFVGPIARHGQSCCLNVALFLAAIAGPILALSLIAQVVPLPFRRGRDAVRLTLWTLGWSAWLFSGAVSFSHALF
jgi:hypothetical protein